jgi:hypothetical protein
VASKSLVEWLKMLWENEKTSVWCVVFCCSALCPLSCVLSPAAGEFVFLL